MQSADSLAPKPALHVDPSVAQECQGVAEVPHTFIPYDKAILLWAKDRAALGDCKRLDHAKALTIKALVK